MESKEIIVQFLHEFQGSILVVSHDRELLNNVTERTLEMSEGKLTSYLGNYNYYKEKKELLDALAQEKSRHVENVKPVQKKKTPGLSKSKLRDEIEKLEARIEELEVQIEQLNEALTQPGACYSELAKELEASNLALDETMEKWQEKSELLEEAMNQ